MSRYATSPLEDDCTPYEHRITDDMNMLSGMRLDESNDAGNGGTIDASVNGDDVSSATNTFLLPENNPVLSEDSEENGQREEYALRGALYVCIMIFIGKIGWRVAQPTSNMQGFPYASIINGDDNFVPVNIEDQVGMLSFHCRDERN